MEIAFGKGLADDRRQWGAGLLVSRVKISAANERNVERLEVIPLNEIGGSNQETLACGPHMALRCDQRPTFWPTIGMLEEKPTRCTPGTVSILRCSSA